ncbi:MAG TPA: hypothetical protein VHD61_03010 [Lacunisphaera sp.]|nr:hypothetical protein [Lacunisphaera sp.]
MDITPPLGTDMPAWARKADGVHDPLFARALVLDDGASRLAVVSLDQCMLYDVIAPSYLDGPEPTDLGRMARIRREVQAATGIDMVICAASHTHSSGGEKGPESWLREEERRIVGAVTEAASRLRPATVGVGWGVVHEGFNRRLPQRDGPTKTQWDDPDRTATGPTDPALGVISVQTDDGTAIATLVNFACHAVILGPKNTRFSADYPGALARKVEHAIGGECLFLQGAAGDTDPFVCLLSEATGADAELDRLGSVIAREALATVAQIKVREKAPRLAWRREVVPLASRIDAERTGRKIDAEIDTILIGEGLALATFPGEFFVAHGLTLKRLSPVPNTFFVGYCNGFLGYFPTIQASMEGGYGTVWRWWAQTEIGAGELLVNRAVINLGLATGAFKKAEETTVMPKR